MFNVYNLTKMPLAFQGKLIPAGQSAEFPIITDFVTLSAYCNSNKVTYNQFTKVVKDAEKVVEPVVEEKVIEPVVEEVPTVEEVPEVAEEVFVAESPAVVEKPATKKRRTSKDDK